MLTFCKTNADINKTGYVLVLKGIFSKSKYASGNFSKTKSADVLKYLILSSYHSLSKF